MEFFGAKRRFFLEIFFGDFRREAPIFFGDFGDFLEILKFFLEFSEILGDFWEIFWEVFFGGFFWRFSPRSGEFFFGVFGVNFGVFSPRSGENLEVFFGGFLKKTLVVGPPG